MGSDCCRYEELDRYIESLCAERDPLIRVLHKAQEIYGFLSEELQIHVGEKMDIPASKVYGVVSFYSYFTMEPRGKVVINVCMGTACFVRGAEDVLRRFEAELGLRAGQTDDEGMYTLQVLRCVGACGLAPVVTVNDKVYGRVTPERVSGILAEYGGGAHEVA